MPRFLSNLYRILPRPPARALAALARDLPRAPLAVDPPAVRHLLDAPPPLAVPGSTAAPLHPNAPSPLAVPAPPLVPLPLVDAPTGLLPLMTAQLQALLEIEPKGVPGLLLQVTSRNALPLPSLRSKS